MPDSIEILPSIVPEHAGDFADGVEIIKTFAPWVHLDIDDGAFTSKYTWPYLAPETLSATPLMFSSLSVEVHLMVRSPQEIGDLLIASGSKRIIVHLESFSDAQSAKLVIEEWRGAGVNEVGIALMYATPLESIASLVDLCDCIHLMSIARIGEQGIPYEPGSVARVEECRKLYPKTLIAVDGGISMANIPDLVHAGARRFVVGSAVMKAPEPQSAYTTLMSAAQAAL